MLLKTINTVKLRIGITLVFAITGFNLLAQDTLNLFQAIKTGLENNYSIQIQKNQVEISGNNNTIGNAGFLPSIDVNASQNNVFNTGNQKYIDGREKELSNSMNNTLNAGINLDWTLFDGFSMFINKDKLELLEEMSDTELQLIVENNVAAIIINYFGIVQEQKLIGVLHDAVDLSMTRKKLAEAKITIGSGSKLMLLQSTVDLNADSTRLLQELTRLINLKADLNKLMCIEPETNFKISDTIFLDTPLNYSDLKEKLQNQNTSLTLARKEQTFSEMNLKDARSLRYPRLNLLGGYNYSQINSQSSVLEYNKSFGPSVGLTLSYNLFNGFNTSRQIKNAGIDMGTADFVFKETDLGLQTELFKLYNEYRSNLDIIKLESVNQEVAKENVDIALEKYKIGSINDIELREIQKKYVEAQYQLLLSEFEAKLAEIELLRISGELYKSISE
jgi:outer membrane protein